MKTNFAQLTLIAALSAVGATTAIADEMAAEGNSLHWATHAAAPTSRPTANQAAVYGHATSGSASRVVTIGGGSRYLNVTQNETVQINVAGKRVTWTFDSFGTAPFPLSSIVPAADGVTVYVAEDPAYRGG